MEVNCENCTMCVCGRCWDERSDYCFGPVPSVPCALFEDVRQLSLFEREVEEGRLRSDAPDSAYQVLQGLCLATDNCI